MARTQSKSPEQWLDEWIGSVADGGSTMSGRKLSSVEKRGGGLEAAASAARKRKVHLLLLHDDNGNQIVAASLTPFKVIA